MKKGYYVWASAAGASCGYFYYSADHPLSPRGFLAVQQRIASQITAASGGVLIPAEAVGIQSVTELPPEVVAERWPRAGGWAEATHLGDRDEEIGSK